MATGTSSESTRSTAAHTPAILITGGSGYVGSHLVGALSEQGETVVSMYRHRLPEPRERVFPVCSDLSAAELLAAPLRGVHTVVHLAWERNFLGPDEDLASTEKSSIPKTRNLKLLANLLAAMEKAGTRRIVFVSALGADQQSEEAFLREKYWGEFLTLNSQISERVVIRPALLYGGQTNREPFVNAIKRVMRFPAIYPLPSGNKKTLHPLHVLDLVAFLKRLVKEPLTAPYGVVDIQGGEAFRVDELFRLVHERLNRGSRLAVGSALGASLVSLFEREGGSVRDYPRLKHFLAIGQEGESQLACENPIRELLPQSYRSFKEAANSDLGSELAASMT